MLHLSACIACHNLCATLLDIMMSRELFTCFEGLRVHKIEVAVSWRDAIMSYTVSYQSQKTACQELNALRLQQISVEKQATDVLEICSSLHAPKCEARAAFWRTNLGAHHN